MSEAEKKSVGYKNPPQHSRFKPGQSGNPKGRPKRGKGSIDIGEYLLRAMPVVINGRRERMSSADLAFKSLMEGVGKRDPHCMKIYFNLLENHGGNKVGIEQESKYDPSDELRRRFQTILDRQQFIREWEAAKGKKSDERT